MLNIMNDKKDVLPLVDTFEEYEAFKSNLYLLETAAKKIMLRHQLPELKLNLFSEGTNIVFEYGENQVIKMFPPFHRVQYQSEWLVLKHLMGLMLLHQYSNLNVQVRIDGWQVCKTVKDLEHLVWGFESK